jgi:protein SCO1/2
MFRHVTSRRTARLIGRVAAPLGYQAPVNHATRTQLHNLQRFAFSTTPEGTSRAAAGGPISWPTLGLLVAVGAGIVGFYNFQRGRKHVEASARVDSYGKPMLGGPWSLVDASGRPVTSGDFEGRYVLLYFGFTFCPDICPNELVKMSRVVDSIGRCT